MWKEEDNKLTKTFTFQDFRKAFKFMTEVTKVVNEMNHHPTWTNTYNKVTIALQTHDAGNIVTDKDRQLATAIDQIFNNQ